MEATQALLAVEGDVEGSAVLTPAIYDIVWSAVAFAITSARRMLSWTLVGNPFSITRRWWPGRVSS